MHILLTNDDGFDSPYLRMLSEAAAKRGHRVTVSAPLTQQSGKSHSFTMTPLYAENRWMEGAETAVAVDGTPADACRVGFKKLCGGRPDLVISGMNNGWNIGMATFVSGTVGAAREAAFQKIPALAVSLSDRMPDATARWFADYAIRTGEKLVNYPVPDMTVVNINCPTLPVDEIKEAQMCGLSYSMYKDDYQEVISPRGCRYFMLGGYEESLDPTPGSDLDLLYRGHVSVTFLTPEGCDWRSYTDFPVWP